MSFKLLQWLLGRERGSGERAGCRFWRDSPRNPRSWRRSPRNSREVAPCCTGSLRSSGPGWGPGVWEPPGPSRTSPPQASERVFLHARIPAPGLKTWPRWCTPQVQFGGHSLQARASPAISAQGQHPAPRPAAEVLRVGRAPGSQMTARPAVRSCDRGCWGPPWRLLKDWVFPWSWRR